MDLPRSLRFRTPDYGNVKTRNPVKIEAIQNFKKLENVKDMQSLLGLAGYHRKFIKSFSIIAKRIAKLTQKNIIFDWTPDWEKAFYDFKHGLKTTPVLSVQSESIRRR